MSENGHPMMEKHGVKGFFYMAEIVYSQLTLHEIQCGFQFDEFLEPSCTSMVDESFEPCNVSFENPINDGDVRMIDFHNPCEGGYWFAFGEPCYDKF